MPSTIRLHRVLAAPPDRVYRAFLDSDAKARWLPPNGYTATVHHNDARVGGSYRMSFTNFGTGSSHSFGGEYLELVPGERLRYLDRFDDPNLPGEMQVTVELRKVSVGTELRVTQEGVPDAIPSEACYLGLAGVSRDAEAARRARHPGRGLGASLTASSRSRQKTRRRSEGCT
jgi:uncharacterized protein YndB with AHSA1/START domain